MKYIILIALLVVCVVGLVSLIRNIKVIVDKKKLLKTTQEDNNTDTIKKEGSESDSCVNNND